MELQWTEFKAFVDARKLSIQWTQTDKFYQLEAYDGPTFSKCKLWKSDPANDDQTDFETNYKDIGNKSQISNVVTAFEISNKDLRTFCGFAETDENGEAEICVQIPSSGRWIACGDAEFEVRHFGDYIKTLEVTDLDRLIAWNIALMYDPEATEPVSDETVQENGYPLYPVLGHFDERAIVETANTKGTIKGGMSMSFQYGITEQEPVGGYAWVPGGFYFRLVGKKASGQTTGHKMQVSIDWAEPNE